MRFRIYLAGPEVFLPGFGETVFKAKKVLCEKFGYQGVSPLDGDPNLDGLTPFAQGLAIYHGNLAHMRNCHAVIANMTPFRGVSMDAGTAFEMGFMAACAKPVLGYSHVTAGFEERSVRYEAQALGDRFDPYCAGTTIERFGMADNLMMAGAVDAAGFQIRLASVPAGDELTALAGFQLCLEDLRSRQGVAERSS